MAIGLLHLIPVPPPPLSRTSFSKGEISHFFQRGNWGKWKKNRLFPEGLKCKNALPEGVQVSSRGVNYTDFFAFQRGKIPKCRGPRQGGFGFLM